MSKFQPKGSPLCGPTSLRNGLYALGKKVSIQKCIDYCALDDHADEFALMRAVREFQCFYSEFQTNERKRARAWLSEGIHLLCIDDWSHWVVVYSIPSGLFQVVDPENDKRNKAEGGNQIATGARVLRRWGASARAQSDPTDATYYGLKIWRA